MPGIFISYRREDSSGYAGRLFDILSTRFGREHTYMDLDTIKGGDNFVAVIEDKVRQCDVLLALIGERWLTITGENGTTRRLEMPGDFVRLEIAKALERKVRVIPVLVGGASMPHEADLPADLRPLAVHQAMDLRDAHFHADADLLIDLLNRTVPGIRDRPWGTRRFPPLAAAAIVVASPCSPAAWCCIGRRGRRIERLPSRGARTGRKRGRRLEASVKPTGRYSAETFDFDVTGQEISERPRFGYAGHLRRQDRGQPHQLHHQVADLGRRENLRRQALLQGNCRRGHDSIHAPHRQQRRIARPGSFRGYEISTEAAASSLTGRTSMLPSRAGGIFEAIWIASSKSSASIR